MLRPVATNVFYNPVVRQRADLGNGILYNCEARMAIRLKKDGDYDFENVEQFVEITATSAVERGRDM
jgi:hypothetical protein